MKEYKDEFDLCPFCGYINDTPAKSKNHLEPGTEIANRYIIGKSLGQGGFGITYIAWDNKIQKTVTIKEFFPNALSTRGSGEVSVSCFNDRAEVHFKEGMKKMLDEGRRLSKFTDNENIVDVYDFFEENNTSYIVMEYLNGKDLKHYLEEKGGKLSPEEAVEIILPVLNALSDMHKAQLIHRDVAPDNIFLCDNGKIKLLDFGSARLAVDENEKSLSIMLKHGFAPKEQYSSRSKQGPWTDVYAVCATLYRIITGEVPPDSIDRKSDSLKPLSSFGVTGFAALEEVISKGLEIEPEDRYQDVKTLAEKLKEAVIFSKGIIIDPPPPPRPKKIILFVIAVAMIVVFSTVFFVFKNKSSENNDNNSSTESTTEQTTEDTPKIISADIFETFLNSDSLKKDYPDIYAIKTKDISACSADFAEYIKTCGVKDFSSATIDIKYLDLDSDGVEEILLSTDATGNGSYVDLYLFDIDEKQKVFLGGTFLKLSPDSSFNHISVMQNSEIEYHIMKFQGIDDFEMNASKYTYTGKSVNLEFQMFATNPYRKDGYGVTTYKKTDSNGNLTEITSFQFFEIWNNCFNANRVTGYCDTLYEEWKKNYNQKAPEENTWKSSYVELLRTVKRDETYVFALGFVDDDDIPELFISKGGSHPCGVEVYTYYNNKTVFLCSGGEFGYIKFIEHSGYICGSYTGMGHFYADVYKMSNGKAELLYTASDNSGADPEARGIELERKINNSDVSEKEMNEFTNKYYGKNSICVGMDTSYAYEPTEENYKKYITDFNGTIVEYPTMITVPKLVGWDIETAKAFAESVGLVCHSDIIYRDSDKPEGIVIEQSLDEGDKVILGSVISIAVSTGIREMKTAKIKVALPNKGAAGQVQVYVNNEFADTKTLLFDGTDYTFLVDGSGEASPVKFFIDGKEYYSCTVDFSKTEPVVSAGMYAADKSTSALFEERKPIPSVVGLSMEVAEAQLRAQGFNNIKIEYTIVYDPTLDGKVQSQSPSASSTGILGMTITYPLSEEITLVVAQKFGL